MVLALSDKQMHTVQLAAASLDVNDRDDFLRSLSKLLRHRENSCASDAEVTSAIQSLLARRDK
jgi:hypothetical protein